MGYNFFQSNLNWSSLGDAELMALPFLAFICPIFSAYRLAKFNIDTEQTNSFIGLPTPANALLIGGLVFIQQASAYSGIVNIGNELWFILGMGILGCSLLNGSLPMFSLKLKDYSWKNNSSIYLFLILCLVLLITLKLAAISFMIVFYITYSLLKNTLSAT
jgi:CDP-diacylglycerol--serine O-phosphatidyltransferase